MFRCERCGSRFSAMHAATIENCPRCLIRDRVSSRLSFKAFQLPEPQARKLHSASGKPQQERTGGLT